MAEKKDKSPSNEKTYLVKYRLKGEEGRTPRKITVQALNQSDAKKTAIATIPGAEVVGGAKELSEGVMDFASRLGKFAARCAGGVCHAYSKTPITDRGSIGTTRKIMTRELAHVAGNKLMRIGGGVEQSAPKIKISSGRKKKKKTTTTARKKKRSP